MHELADPKPKDSDSPLLAALAYVLGAVVALLLYLFKKDDEYVRFNSLQALIIDVIFMVVWLCGFVVTFLSFFTFILAFLFTPLMFLLFFVFIAIKFYLAYKAYTGSIVEIPYVSSFVRAHLG